MIKINATPKSMENERSESFGERFGFAERPQLQYDTLNTVTRTDLFNTVYMLLELPYKVVKGKSAYEVKMALEELDEDIWTKIFNENILDFKNRDINGDIRQTFNRAKFHEVFDFIERLLSLLPSTYFPLEVVIDILNKCLVRNSVAWRINAIGQFVPVSNEVELKEIDLVIQNSEQNDLPTIAKHLKTAIDMLSGQPDKNKLRLSIKESISMVGVVARKIAGENDLGKALFQLEKIGLITASLKDKFKNYYSYTSGKNGIRHELMEESNLDYEEAKYFLVTCSAFTNYLVEKCLKAKSNL